MGSNKPSTPWEPKQYGFCITTCFPPWRMDAPPYTASETAQTLTFLLARSAHPIIVPIIAARRHINHPVSPHTKAGERRIEQHLLFLKLSRRRTAVPDRACLQCGRINADL